MRYAKAIMSKNKEEPNKVYSHNKREVMEVGMVMVVCKDVRYLVLLLDIRERSISRESACRKDAMR